MLETDDGVTDTDPETVRAETMDPIPPPQFSNPE
ncbi:hypothetical protein FHT76_005762 [Rhizobium sp. BK176]|nr:hypothetical protein [Rhizobium sp. BK181]MCS3742154.1 hypothetical protein [Rhizobium sp. BK661]MCS4094062.1 hypothetical protein [Rhizobium sp. BK176]